MAEKVSFNIASEFNIVDIMRGQKLIKKAMFNFGEFLKILSLCPNSVTRQVTFNRTTLWLDKKCR